MAESEETGHDLRLYAEYLEACELFERGGTRNMQASVRRFADIVRSDPGFALAHVGIAKALAIDAMYYNPRDADLPRALDHCETAIRIDARLAEAFAVLGFVHAVGGRFDRARQPFRRAVGVGPQSGDVHYFLGRACFAELDFRTAGPLLERTASLRPDDYHSLMLAGKARLLCGDDASARSNFGRAAARIQLRLEADRDDRAVCALTRCLVHLGNLDEAFRILDRARDHSDPMNYHLACTFARVGEADRALDTLELVIEHGWCHAAWLERDPDFDALRNERRFKRIARSISSPSANAH